MSTSGGPAATAAPTTAQNARKWFPPATFQLRLRAIKSISYLDIGPVGDGVFRISFHHTLESPPFRSFDTVHQSIDERVIWSELDVCGPQSGCKGCVIRVSHLSPAGGSEDNSGTVLLTAIVSLSGLHCLGIHLPPLGKLERNALVFHMSGSYFTTTATATKKHLFFGPFAPHQVLRSSETSLLARCLRTHRAMVQQNATNRIFKEDLVTKGLDLTAKSLEKVAKPSTRTLREQVFGLCTKEAVTRVSESTLKRKIEMLRVKVEFYRDEKKRTMEKIQRTLRDISALHGEINDRTIQLMNNFHGFSKDRVRLNSWLQKYHENRGFCKYLDETVTTTRLAMLSSFKLLFPIHNHLSKTATIRWVLMPSVEKARTNSQQEVMYSVALGWIAQLLTTFATVVDVPLRYPIRFSGSMSTIADLSLGDDCDFPLYAKNCDASRSDYGLFLVNKDLAQLRWYFGLVTTDLKNTFKNLFELMDLGSDSVQTTHSKLCITYLSPPPRTASSSQHREQSSVTVDCKDEHAEDDSSEGGMVLKICEDPPLMSERKTVTELNGKIAGKELFVVKDVKQFAWGDVTDERMNALSIPTSFQRHRKQDN